MDLLFFNAELNGIKLELDNITKSGYITLFILFLGDLEVLLNQLFFNLNVSYRNHKQQETF